MRPEVWAPRARRVELVVGDGSDESRIPLRGPDERGWHRSEATVPAGTDYGWSLDGGPVRADPRSHWQPNGTAGRSRVVDHQRFAWTDQRWHGRPLAGSVFYEVHVGTFTAQGTFDAAITRLDHLVDLGATTIELMPLAEFPGDRGWGYDGVFLYAPHHAYGGPDGLKRFVDAAHERGLAVMLDVVYNHLGPRDAYHDEFGPYTNTSRTTAWGTSINLDGPGSDAVRAFVIDNARHWLVDHHFDGLRLDATHALVDASAIHVLAELAGEVRALEAHLRRPLLLVAENDRNDPGVSGAPPAGWGLDAQWSDDFHHALHAILTGERGGYYGDFGAAEQLVTAFVDGQVYSGQWSPVRQRRHGRAVAPEVARCRFVIGAQNHDQVGNRARGDRLVHLVGLAGARLAAALTLTHPGTPLLFQGEEWGASAPFPFFADYDGELADAVRDGRRAEFAAFGWAAEDVPDPVAMSTFGSAALDWSERTQGDHAALLDWYRALLALRARWAQLSDPRLRATRAWLQDGVLVVERGVDDVVRIHANLGTVAVPFELADGHVVMLADPSSGPDVLGPYGVCLTAPR